MLITQHSFTDIENFSETLGEYNFESRQVEPGKFSATSLQVNTGKALLTRLTTNLALEVEGSPPRSMITVGVPMATCRPFVWRHRQSNANTLQFYRPDSELCVNSLGQFDAISTRELFFPFYPLPFSFVCRPKYSYELYHIYR